MFVAKSFQSFEKLTEPYIVNGRYYIKVRNPKTGTERQVRAYSEQEYLKMYPSETPVIQAQETWVKPQKEVLGFDKGYITIFKAESNIVDNEEWLKKSAARYAIWWGWYFISTIDLPEDMPEDLIPIQLPWELVGNENGKIKSAKEIQTAVTSIMYDAGTSEWVGAIGDRIEIEISVLRAIDKESYYGGIATTHIMRDFDGNEFVWTTSSKHWAENSIKRIRGTIKDHRTYNGQKQTILTRCTER